jgi:hypothetical protein
MLINPHKLGLERKFVVTVETGVLCADTAFYATE